MLNALVRICAAPELVCELNQAAGEKNWQQHYRLVQKNGILPERWDEACYKDWLFHCESLYNSDYQAPSLPVTVDVFMALERGDGDDMFGQPYLGWNRILDEDAIHITPVPGDHYHLLSAPHIQETYWIISAAIAARRACQITRNQPVPEDKPLVTLQPGSH